MTDTKIEFSRRKALVAGAAAIAAPAIIGSSAARAQEKVVWKVQSHFLIHRAAVFLVIA